MQSNILNPQEEKEQELKRNIDFFIRHLDLKELIVLEKVAHQLADNYSSSYADWKLSDYKK